MKHEIMFAVVRGRTIKESSLSHPMCLNDLKLIYCCFLQSQYCLHWFVFPQQAEVRQKERRGQMRGSKEQIKTNWKCAIEFV